MKLPWKTKGIVLTAPLTEEVDDVVKFIDEYLAPRGFNMIVMQIRYRYQFRRHPECCGYDPLSEKDVKKIVAVCRKHNIKLVPKMNLCDHQSGLPANPTDGILHGHSNVAPDIKDGLLRAYPEFDELQNEPAVFYSRSICLSNPIAKIVIFELIDEMMEAFETDTLHIACDEVLHIGKCPTCSKIPKAQLYASWVNSINEHVRSRGGRIMMWGDRLVSVQETGYNSWEASETGTEEAINLISKDVVVCDWHYEDDVKFVSVDLLAKAGFKIMVCPWRNQENAERFLSYAMEHDNGHINGVLMTTWCGSGDLAKRLLYGTPGRWTHTDQIAATIEDLSS